MDKQLIITVFLAGLTLGLLVAVVMTYKSSEMVCFENKEAFIEYNKQSTLQRLEIIDKYKSCVTQQQKETIEEPQFACDFNSFCWFGEDGRTNCLFDEVPEKCQPKKKTTN